MLRENLISYNLPTNDDLSIESDHEILLILDFIDRTISGFRSYYLTLRDSDRENRISDFLINHFQICLRDEKSEGFPPFDFRKNPTQATSTKETDIGVIVLTKNTRPVTILEFEAKRLSDTSNNKEYVCGNRGGIERFKKGLHASHLLVCGMFGYVQSKTSLEWVEKINTWLVELSQIDDDRINWKNPDEKLSKVKDLGNVEKWTSVNDRINIKALRIYHYFINLN